VTLWELLFRQTMWGRARRGPRPRYTWRRGQLWVDGLAVPLAGGSGENARIDQLVNARRATGGYADCPNPAGVNATLGYLQTIGTRYYTIYAILTPGTGATTASCTFTMQVSPVGGVPTSTQWINLPTSLMASQTLNSGTPNALVAFTAPLFKIRINVSAYTQATNNDDQLNVWLQSEN